MLLALLVGGTLLVATQTRALNQAIDTVLEGRVSDLAGLIADGVIPRSISVSGDESALAQIVGPDGSVVASSENIDGEEPLSSGELAKGEITTGVVRGLPIDEGSYRFAATLVSTPTGQHRVYVANSVEVRTLAVSALVAALLVGIPLLSAITAVSAWHVIGRTLTPVEAIRAEVETITGSDLHRRVPEPTREDEIGRLAHTMNTMLERLEHAARQQDEFVANAAHELRSPLAGIRAELEVDEAHPRPEAWSETRASVLEESIRLQTLIDDLLLLAKGAATSQSHKEIDLDDVVFHALSRMPIPEIDIDSSAVSPAKVMGDSAQLERVVANLLDNAARHASSTISLALSAADGVATLLVGDDGEGVADEDREKVFERFVRADEARSRDAGGTGLGLAIVAEIVHRHSGNVSVSDSPLGGAIFSVTIPTAGPGE